MAKFKKKETKAPEAHEEMNELLEEVLSPENPEELKEVIEHITPKKEQPKKGFFAPIVPDVIMPEIVKLTEQLHAMNESLKKNKPAAPAATTEPQAQQESNMDEFAKVIDGLKSEMAAAREESAASAKKISTGLWVAGGLIATGLVAGGALYVRHMSNKAGFDGDMTSF